MKLNDEIDVVYDLLHIANILYTNLDISVGQYFYMGDGTRLHTQRNTIYRNNGNAWYTIYEIEPYDDLCNMSLNNKWVFNYQQKDSICSSSYTLVDSYDDEEYKCEDFVDSFIQNGRLYTEDEFFQCTLIHSGLNMAYEDAITRIKALHNKPKNMLGDRGASIKIYLEDDINPSFIKDLTHRLRETFGIDFRRKKK